MTFETPDSPIDDEAAQWLAALRSDQCTNLLKQEFSVWLAESEQHQIAFDRQLDLFEALGSVSPGLAPEPKQCVPQPFNWLWPSTAAAAFASCLLAVWLTLGGSADSSIKRSHYQTSIGEHRTLTLADGSVIELNTNSSISVQMSDQRRSIQLHRGEAYFSVAKDHTRPFVVELARGSVTALGTEFNIYRKDHLAQVDLIEGAIRVKDTLENTVDVSAGLGLALTDRGLQASEPIVSERLDWRLGQLNVQSQPLQEVVDTLSRYLDQSVNLAPELRYLEVSGHFNLRAPQAALEALALSHQLDLVVVSDALILKAKDLPIPVDP